MKLILLETYSFRNNIVKYILSKDRNYFIYKKALSLAKSRGVDIFKNKELAYYILEDEEVIAGLFISDNLTDFGFDIVVDKEYENQGIGKELTKKALEIYKNLKLIYGDDYFLDVEVISPKYKDILTKNFNLKIKQDLKDSKWIMTE